jgi:hypothetical protein
MQNHQTTSIIGPATSCGLATASLVCGICGFILGPFTGIPAIITGHMALGRIKKSEGVLQGHGTAIAGLILGYIFTAIFVIILPILSFAGYAAGNAAIERSRRVTALATSTALETAVNDYFTEYGSLPYDGESDVTVQTDTDTKLLSVLLGLENKLNTRSVKFLSVREGRSKKNGLIYNTTGDKVVGLFDPWGGGYKVRLDLDHDEKLELNREALNNRRVAVWSDGPDRTAGTKDDIKTW